MCTVLANKTTKKVSIYCSKELLLYYAFDTNVLLISGAQEVNEYLSTPIDQFVASRALVGGPAGGCTFSIVWISDPEQENIYTSGAESQSCTLQGQLLMSSDDQVERRVLLDKYPA